MGDATTYKYGDTTLAPLHRMRAVSSRAPWSVFDRGTKLHVSHKSHLEYDFPDHAAALEQSESFVNGVGLKWKGLEDNR